MSRSFVVLTSHLLSANVGEATIICYCGWHVDYFNALHKSPGCKPGIQYSLSLTPLQLEQLLHKPSFSVMGKIDMLSMLRNLLQRLRGLLDECWVQSVDFFRRVYLICEIPILLCLTRCQALCCVLKALKERQLELSTVFLVVEEMLTHWPQVISYIGATAQGQTFKHVEGKVCIFAISCVAFCW